MLAQRELFIVEAIRWPARAVAKQRRIDLLDSRSTLDALIPTVERRSRTLVSPSAQYFRLRERFRKVMTDNPKLSDCGDESAPEVSDLELEVGYKEMAEDLKREAEAREWAEATIGDIADESR